MIVLDFVYKIAAILTLPALVYYAFETYKIRKIDTQQKDLQLLPAMMIYIRRGAGSERPVLRNVGYGTAVGISIPNFKLTSGNETLEFNFHLTDGNNTLKPEEERNIGVNLEVNGVLDHHPLPTFLVYFDPARLDDIRINAEAGVIRRNTTVSRTLNVNFLDIIGQKYKTSINFSPNGISVADTPKRIK